MWCCIDQVLEKIQKWLRLTENGLKYDCQHLLSNHEMKSIKQKKGSQMTTQF